MKYLIVNNSTFDEFLQKARSIAQMSGSVSIAYVEHADADGKAIPGGWGCVRFLNELPSSVVFLPPDVEYRYFVAQDAWLTNGEPTEYSEWVKTLFEYFLSASWWVL